MDKACAQGGVDDQIVTSFGGKAVVFVHPCGGNAHNGKQRVNPHVVLAIIGRDIQRGQKCPSGNTHGERDDDDEREQFGACKQVAGVAACVGGQELLGAGELTPAGHDDVAKGEKAAIVERLGMILRFVCAFGFVVMSHIFLF